MNIKPIDIPAFPVDARGVASLGMTLRDYFAAKAMQSMVHHRCYPWDRVMPRYAYEIADAMLQERAK
jgi:hypothetical protein